MKNDRRTAKDWRERGVLVDQYGDEICELEWDHGYYRLPDFAREIPLDDGDVLYVKVYDSEY